MKKTLCLILSIILFIGIIPASAFADTFTLRNGIMFGDSYAAVRSKETLPFSEEDDNVLEDGTRQVFLEEGRVAGIDDCTVMFRFTPDDKLTEMKYSYMFLTSKDEIEQDYSTVYSGLKRKYGTPLNNTGGSLFVISTNAVDSAAGLVALYNMLELDADYMDYDEWVVDLDSGDHVKIDMISYYTGAISDRTYHLHVGYKLFTDKDLAQAVEENVAQRAEIDNDL